MRGSVMTEADVVITLGRKLDFQLAYGSPAIFGDAKFVRIADCASEIRDNRRGEAEVFATVSIALEKIIELAGDRKPNIDKAWAGETRTKHEARAQKLLLSMQDSPVGSDGLMHPNTLLAALEKLYRKTLL